MLVTEQRRCFAARSRSELVVGAVVDRLIDIMDAGITHDQMGAAEMLAFKSARFPPPLAAALVANASVQRNRGRGEGKVRGIQRKEYAFLW